MGRVCQFQEGQGCKSVSRKRSKSVGCASENTGSGKMAGPPGQEGSVSVTRRDKARRQRHSRTFAMKTDGITRFLKIIGGTGVLVVEKELEKQQVPGKGCHLERCV